MDEVLSSVTALSKRHVASFGTFVPVDVVCSYKESRVRAMLGDAAGAQAWRDHNRTHLRYLLPV